MAQSALIFAKQTAGWGGSIPSTGWREVPVAGDGWKTRAKPRTFTGISSSAGSAASAKFFRQVIEGGDGVFDVPGISNGLGILFETMADSAASVLVTDATTAHEQTFLWGPAGPPAAAVVAAEFRRLRKGTSTLDAFTHPGCRGVQLDIGQDVDANLSLKFQMDSRPPVLQGSLPARTIAEVDPDVLYGWDDATISIDGTEVCATSINASLPTGNDVDDKCIKRNDNRHVPMRKGRPELTGSLNWDYTNPVYYQAWIAGDILPFELAFQGPVPIEAAIYPTMTLTGSIRFTGDDPQVSVDDPTKQSLPFEFIVDDDNPLSLVNVTSDAAL